MTQSGKAASAFSQIQLMLQISSEPSSGLVQAVANNNLQASGATPIEIQVLGSLFLLELHR